MAASVSVRLKKGVDVCVRLFFFLCFLMLRAGAQNSYKSVNLGGWLVVEKWLKPDLFRDVPDMTDGAQIQLKSVKLGTYVVAQDGGGKSIAVDRNSPSGWETFKLWRVKEGTFQLRVFNKQFIGADKGGGGIVNAIAEKPSTWETFDIFRNPANSNLVHIRASNGMYLQATTPDQLTADFQGEPGWDDNNSATFEMNLFGQIEGEYQLTNGLGPEKAKQVLNDHWSTFITEEDFAFLSNNGINAVRIPVGWWIANNSNPPPPFVGGSLDALDNAFSWANNYGLKIIVDLHAAPGSQNGEAHSATRDGYIEWSASQDNIDTSLSAIDFLAERYANKPAFLGIELLNEPHSPDIPLDKLTAYYRDGYKTIRKYSPTAYVVMCNRLGNGANPKELFQMTNGLSRTVVDVHWYNLFSDTFNGMTAQQNIDYINNEKASDLADLMSGNGPLIYVGEWTTSWKAPNPSQSEYQAFGRAQQQVYGKASFGWAFWTHRRIQNEVPKPWSFEWMVQNNYLQIV